MLTALQTGVTVQPTILPDNSSQTTTVVAPTTASVNTTSSNTGNPQLAIIVSGVLISISIVVGFLLMKSPPPITVTEKTPSSKPSETPQSVATNPVNPPNSVKPSETPPSVIKPPVAPQKPITPTETPPSVIQKIKPIITPPAPVNIAPPPITPQSNDYSWVSQKVVTSGDLVGKTAFELDIIRNSIYARHGRRFRSAELQNFFNTQFWYNPTYSPDSFPDKLLSPLERQNAAYILAYQNRNGLRWVK